MRGGGRGGGDGDGCYNDDGVGRRLMMIQFAHGSMGSITTMVGITVLLKSDEEKKKKKKRRDGRER